MARPKTGETFIARVRIPLDDWRDLEKHFGEKRRAPLIRGHVKSLNSSAELWLMALRIAEIRGENIWDVITATMKRYVARNRHLLDEE